MLYCIVLLKAERESYGSEGCSSDNTEQLEEENDEVDNEDKNDNEEDLVRKKPQKKARPYKVFNYARTYRN